MLIPVKLLKALPHCVQHNGLQSITHPTLRQCRTKEKGKSTSIKAVCTGLRQAVPFLSVAFDLARAIHLNPATDFPAASTIQHGRA